jgi:hypothetical protein
MAKILEIADGLRILAKYDSGFCVGAEHDEIHAGPDKASTTVSAEDQAELKKLGWIVDEDLDIYLVFP